MSGCDTAVGSLTCGASGAPASWGLLCNRQRRGPSHNRVSRIQPLAPGEEGTRQRKHSDRHTADLRTPCPGLPCHLCHHHRRPCLSAGKCQQKDMPREKTRGSASGPASSEAGRRWVEACNALPSRPKHRDRRPGLPPTRKSILPPTPCPLISVQNQSGVGARGADIRTETGRWKEIALRVTSVSEVWGPTV